METVLRRLRIENLVLIREAELELDGGLNAITGETGAGKTILSGAIGLLLGAKGDTGAIGAAAEEAYVEAEFDLPEEEALGELAALRPEGEEMLVLARRIFADGRTRACAWGRGRARGGRRGTRGGGPGRGGRTRRRAARAARARARGCRRVAAGRRALAPRDGVRREGVPRRPRSRAGQARAARGRAGTARRPAS